MIANSSLFLFILPESFQIILINLILLFGMAFSWININKLNLSTINYSDSDNSKINTDLLRISMPTLLTETITLLMTLGLGSCALLYLNSALTYSLYFGLISDNLGQFMSVCVCFSAMAALGISIHALNRFSRYEYIIILWLSVIGMLCLIKSYSFLAFYLSIELQSLSFYMLAAMRSRSEYSIEAALKYFILSAFSSAILLLGIALIYSAIGSQSLADLAIVIKHFAIVSDHNQMGIDVGLGCIGISLLFKLGAAPFHAWIADVYEGTHTSITAWFAIPSKIAIVTALIRINSSYTLFYFFSTISVISLLVGSLNALRQVKLKRLIAFSAVTNAGWFLLALSIGQWLLMIIHLIIYILLSINLFSIFLLPQFRELPYNAYRLRILKASNEIDLGVDSSTIKYISDLNQLYKSNPSLAFAVSISLFSFAGIPPLAGFYSKYLIINAVVQTEQFLVLAIALGAAVISAFYYIRIVRTIYFSTSEQWFTLDILPSNSYITSLTTILIMVFFIKPDSFLVWLPLL